VPAFAFCGALLSAAQARRLCCVVACRQLRQSELVLARPELMRDLARITCHVAEPCRPPAPRPQDDKWTDSYISTIGVDFVRCARAKPPSPRPPACYALSLGGSLGCCSTSLCRRACARPPPPSQLITCPLPSPLPRAEDPDSRA
jgi:hypothetical protein